MITNLTIKMKSVDSITLSEHEIQLIGVDPDQIKTQITNILTNNEILGIYDLEKELEKLGYTNHGVTGETIYTIYENIYEYIIRIQKETYIDPEDYNITPIEGDLFTEYHTTEFIHIKKYPIHNGDD